MTSQQGPNPSEADRRTGNQSEAGQQASTRPVSARTGGPWGMIASFTASGVLALGSIGYAAWPRTTPPTGDKIAAITGVVNYRASDPGSLTRNHRNGVLAYKLSPPVGGDHNPVWQNCAGTVYPAPIASEHAVHSLEHGAVWITHRPDLPADQITALAGRVHGHDYTLMSPYPRLDTPISLQAWGYRLAVDTAGDQRIDEFITAARVKAAAEPGATCSGGITTTPTDGGAATPQGS
jgi:hypothetical protein